MQPAGAEQLARDVSRLDPGRLHASTGDFQVWLASARELPHILPEIGRLREVTFRAVGQGSGKIVDLDDSIAKSDEATVLTEYGRSGGRRGVENIVLGQLRQELRDEYKGYTTLLKYWRDQAAHGKASGIGENEAYTSLALLLRAIR